jgi:sugar lactone lactonase YvrE
MRTKKLAPFALLLVSVSLLGRTVVRADAPPARQIGDSKVIAAVPFPGYPEGIAVHDGLIYTSGPAAFGVPGNFVPSKIFAFDEQTGALVKTIVVEGQQGPLNALSCLAFGDGDDLYVLDEGQGVLKINVETGRQSVYSAGFHPVYQSAFNPPAPVLLNDLAFDKRGNLYVNDKSGKLFKGDDDQ